MDNRYVLIVVSLNSDGTDLSGMKYPESGYVECKNFKPDKDIRYGLYGTLWGKTENSQWLNKHPQAKWVIIQTSMSDDIIMVDQLHNFVKFRTGIVMCHGSLEECVDYVTSKNLDENLLTSLCGNRKVSKQKEEHIFSKGFKSQVVAEASGTHAINVGTKSVAKVGDLAAAIVLGPESNVVAGETGMAVGLAYNCTGSVGPEGVLLLSYSDGIRERVAIGYAGENIEANKTYRVNEKGKFELLDTVSGKQ